MRCSGGTPCGRCDTRSLECQYPTERRSKGKTRVGASKGLSRLEIQEQESQTPQTSFNRLNGDETESMEIEHASSYQMGGFSVNDIHGTTSPKAANTFSPQVKAHAENTPSDGRASLVGAFTPSLYLPSNQLQTSARLPLSIYPNADSQQPHGMTSPEVPKMFSVDLTSGLGPNMRNFQPDMTSSGAVDMEIDMSGNAEMTLEFDPSLFDQSMLSTINWLPNEFFTSASNEQSQLSGVPSQHPQPAVSDSYATRMAWHPPVINTEQSPSMAENLSHTPSGHVSLGTDMESPRRYSHVGSEASPHSESVDSTKRSSDYYVDGGGARLPKYRKKQAPWSTSAVETAAVSGQLIVENISRRYGFPSTHGINLDNVSEVAISVKPIETNTHRELYRNFLLLCRTDNPFFEMFESENFPTAEECTGYLACYFDSFHDVYPILHLPTFDPSRCHWLLVLAIVAIGCHTSNIHDAHQCMDAFNEMIRRAIYVEVRVPFYPRDSMYLQVSLGRKKNHTHARYHST